MSIENFVRYEFLRLKDLGPEFTVFVKGYREMETKFGLGHYLIVEVGKKTKPKQKLQTGLLKISMTTGGSIAALIEIEHLSELKNHFIDFEFNEDVHTILAKRVYEGVQ